MSNIIGIDEGTNSIGWQIIDNDQGKILSGGVVIFEDALQAEKDILKSSAAERTRYRLARRQKFRRRLRKYHTLKVLIKYKMCPLSLEELDKWIKYRKGLPKEYPSSPEFIKWLRTDVKENINPYVMRANAVEGPLPPMELGRAFYHIAQRRGYKSNRLEDVADDSKKAGAVQEGINEIDKILNGRTLGQCFRDLIIDGVKVRGKYTSREKHYLEEFNRICEKQSLDKSLVEELKKAIFFQRPLKSQKHLVGKCPFEKNKPRCPISHPDFEEFRMLQVLNNIRYKESASDDWKELSSEQRKVVEEKFFRKSKKHFDFEDIRKALAGKKGYIFNYRDSQGLSGSIVSLQLKEIFGDSWHDTKIEYLKPDGSKSILDIHAIWNALFFFDDNEKLKDFAKNRLHLDEEKAKLFSGIRLPQGYAQLSLNAIRKFLPFLRKGYPYSTAGYLANIPHIAGQVLWHKEQEDIENRLLAEIKDYKDEIELLKAEHKRPLETLHERLKNTLVETWDVASSKALLFYNPSDIETYHKVKPSEDGNLYLPKVEMGAMRNPMALRSMTILRRLLNSLLKEGKITPETIVHIELARKINSINMRKAIEIWNKKREKENQEIIGRIQEYTGPYYTLSSNDILKYRFWEEQGNNCLYTGKKIGISDFISEHPEFDVEHTIPVSISGDDSQINKTLCELKFNREIKHSKIPSECPDYETVLQRIDPWKEKLKDLEKKYDRARNMAKMAQTKEDRDNRIVDAHVLKFDIDYWRRKIKFFEITKDEIGDVAKFRSRQLADTGMITKHCVSFLKTVFNKVYTVNGSAVAFARKEWGIQDEYAKKDRSSHIHHLIDASVIACLDKNRFDAIAEAFKEPLDSKVKVPTPWYNFVKDLKVSLDSAGVTHLTRHFELKKSGRNIDTEGGVKLQHSDSVRGQLHKETFYGKIHTPKTKEKPSEERIVLRTSVQDLKESDIPNVVDPVVRKKLEDYFSIEKSFKEIQNRPVWMNEDKKIQINSVRLYANASPRILKAHRDSSTHNYKKHYLVESGKDSNFIMAIYRGKNAKEKIVNSFKLINLFDAAKEGLSISKEFNELSLWGVIRPGSIVIFYENNPAEISGLPLSVLQKRLYKVTVMEKDGRIQLRHILEARPDKDLDHDFTQINFEVPVAKLRIRLNYFLEHALIQEKDFSVSYSGKIIFKV